MRAFFVATILLTLPACVSVTPANLEGHWLHEPYITSLEESRSLLTAARAATPLTFSVARDADGQRMSVSTFHEASWHAVARLESTGLDSGVLVLGPYETPLAEASEFTRVAFEGERDRGGRRLKRVRMTLWGAENAWFRRIDVSAEEFVNRLLVSGTWRDLEGGRWAFDASGRLLGPEGAARFTLSIDTSEACCDYMTIGEERLGFALRDDALWMYRVIEDPEGCPISCDRTRPLRILVRDVPGDTRSRAALSRLELAPVTGGDSRWGAHGARVAVAFDDPDRRPDPKTFPDSAAIVSDSSRGTRCTIDGGIWARDMVWLSADESLVAFVTHSGSSSDLEIYQTRNCQQTARVPVSARSVRVSADRVEHDGICEPYGTESWDCFPAAIWRLRPDGTLEHLVEESARRTRGVFGMAFTDRSDIDRPWTDDARPSAVH